MLLTIFLGLIATLTSVSGECDVGISEGKYFDWYEFSGPRPWYAFWHTPNEVENNLACVSVIFERPERNTSLITIKAFQISEQRQITVNGNAINWNSTGYWEEDFQILTTWIGRHYVISIDYDHYFIFKHCLSDSKKPSVYVLFRSTHPNEETLKNVKNKLKENDIDFSQLLEFPRHPCQKAELPKKMRNFLIETLA